MLFRLISNWIDSRRSPPPGEFQYHDRRPGDQVKAGLEEGRALEAAGLRKEAEKLYRKLLGNCPTNGEVLYRLGNLLALRGNFDDASALLESALVNNSELMGPRIALANIRLSKKQFHDAVQLYESIHARESDDPGLLNNFGLALYGMHNYTEAREVLEKSISVNPASIEAHTNLGLVHDSEGNAREAERCFRVAFELDPGHTATAKLLCGLLLKEGRTNEAIGIAERSVTANPSSIEAHRIAGHAHFDAGSFVEAETHLRIATRETADAESLTYLARTLQSLGQYSEALEVYDSALGMNSRYVPAAWHRSLLLLHVGSYAQGWRDYEHRLLSNEPPPRHLGLPRWGGESLPDGHLLVYAEQGLGDQIMFASCIPDALEKVNRCTIECSAKLESLLRRSFPQCDVIGTNYENPATWINRVADPTVSIPIGSLPKLFRSRSEDFPSHSGYLVPDPAKVEHWRQTLSALGPGPKIGISWIGGSAKSRQNHRSIPLTRWEPILKTPNVTFVSLQYTSCQPELARVEKFLGVRIHHWQQAIDDYDETAALVAALDLVISVQTAVIHLCGALGRPGWVLVPLCAEWRYGSAGETMDWYPSIRLFRQARLGEWEPVVETVAGELALQVGADKSGSSQ